MVNPLDMVWIGVLTGIITSLTSGMLIQYLSHRYSQDRERSSRQLQFLKQQVEEFYAPLVALRKEMLMMGEIQLLIELEGERLWRALSEGNAVTERGDVSKADLTKSKETVEHHKRLRGETVKSYWQMVKIFREKMSLAEPSTLKHYGSLLRFAEVFDRWSSDTISADAVRHLADGGKELLPFFAELDTQLATKRTQLATGELPGRCSAEVFSRQLVLGGSYCNPPESVAVY